MVVLDHPDELSPRPSPFESGMRGLARALGRRIGHCDTFASAVQKYPDAWRISLSGMRKPQKRGRGAINPDLDRRIGALLRDRRLAMGLSQQALGKKLGLTFQQVQKYENGSNQLSIARLLQLCSALQVPSSYFLDIRRPVAAVEDVDYSAARAFARIQDERVRTAMLRLVRECQRP